MKEWIPIPGSNKDVLIKVALEEFGVKGYEEVNITDLASKANLTTGAVYHHFGSKSNLYEVIRTEMEQRIVDRMEGVVSLFDKPNDALRAALITGLDFAVKYNICKLLSEEISFIKLDKISRFLSEMNPDSNLPIEMILISSWRSVLKGIADNHITYEQGKKLITWVFDKDQRDQQVQ